MNDLMEARVRRTTRSWMLPVFISMALAARQTVDPPAGAQAPIPKASVAPASKAAQAPALLPGEALAMAGPDGTVQGYGEPSREHPMGDLAELAWLRLEGDEWGAQDLPFKCKGTMGAFHCSTPKGHGRVDLRKATQQDCRLAYLAWILDASRRWVSEYGEDAARARLEDGFAPFLGRRLKPGSTLPEFGLEWVGEGDLLRTSPEALAKWMVDPAQEGLLYRCRRLMLSFLVETYQDRAWWIKVASAPVPGERGATSTWVVGSNGGYTAVLHLGPGSTRAQALARFQTLLNLPVKAK